MHAVELIDASTLLTMVIGAILFIVIFKLIFRKKK
jgi:uncharacterized membrane protein YeaQ/YmgE (transglycosylase-associated protein family)